jgi:hypothetical protein
LKLEHYYCTSPEAFRDMSYEEKEKAVVTMTVSTNRNSIYALFFSGINS